MAARTDQSSGCPSYELCTTMRQKEEKERPEFLIGFLLRISTSTEQVRQWNLSQSPALDQDESRPIPAVNIESN